MNIQPTASSMTNYNLEKYGDFITVSKPDIKFHNVIFGTLYADLYGKIMSRNHKTGESATVQMIANGNKSKIDGFVLD